MSDVAVVGRDPGRAHDLAVRLSPRLGAEPAVLVGGRARVVVPAAPFADRRARDAAADGVLVRWDDLPELQRAVAERLRAAVGDDAKAVLVVPAFPAADSRDEGELLDDVDGFGRRAVEEAGLDPWAAAAVAWEPVGDADDYGVRAVDIVGGLADLGRTGRVVLVPVGIEPGHPGVVSAARRGTDAGLQVDVASRADTADDVLDALAARIVGLEQ